MADFTDADLRGSRFERADLAGARFTTVDLSGASFRAVDLTGTVMRGVDLVDADIRAFANVVTIARSRSGDPDSSWSRRKRAGSILLGAVIVMSPSEALWKVFQRITR